MRSHCLLADVRFVKATSHQDTLLLQNAQFRVVIGSQCNPRLRGLLRTRSPNLRLQLLVWGDRLEEKPPGIGTLNSENPLMFGRRPGSKPNCLVERGWGGFLRGLKETPLQRLPAAWISCWFEALISSLI